jgi:hypothetical protein
MEAISSSETLVHIRSTQRHIPEDGFLHSHRYENLKSYIENKLPQLIREIIGVSKEKRTGTAVSHTSIPSARNEIAKPQTNYEASLGFLIYDPKTISTTY